MIIKYTLNFPLDYTLVFFLFSSVLILTPIGVFGALPILPIGGDRTGPRIYPFQPRIILLTLFRCYPARIPVVSSISPRPHTFPYLVQHLVRSIPSFRFTVLRYQVSADGDSPCSQQKITSLRNVDVGHLWCGFSSIVCWQLYAVWWFARMQAKNFNSLIFFFSFSLDSSSEPPFCNSVSVTIVLFHLLNFFFLSDDNWLLYVAMSLLIAF